MQIGCRDSLDLVHRQSIQMDMVDLLTPVLPKGFLIDAVSRLSAKDACRLKVLSKSWFSLISYDSEFKRLHRVRAQQRRPFLVLADAISDWSSPGLFIEHDTNPLCRKVVFNLKLRSHSPDVEFFASCGDLMCFYNDRVVYVYSPSTNQYLRYDTHVSGEFRIAFVNVASMNMYKVVKLDVVERIRSFRSNFVALRFEALTVKEEEDEQDDQPPSGGGQCARGPFFRCPSPWELISEHVMPSGLSGKFGNFIGVNGVVYVTIRLIDFQQAVLLSLRLDDDSISNNKHKFATVALPHAECTTTNNLCQFKDRLCFPHTSASTIDLWLLEDRYTSSWYKDSTISCTPPPHGILQHLDFSFLLADRVSRHEASRLLKDGYNPRRIHVFSDNLYSLKNGLRFTRMPAKAPSPDPMGSGKTTIEGIPTMALIEVVSRLSAKDACKLKVLSKAWLSFVTSNPEFKRLHRLRAPQRPSFLVIAKVFSDAYSPRLFIEDTAPLPDYGSRKVVFNDQQSWEIRPELVSSCRDLMCFSNVDVVYIYSPSANQYLCFDILVSSSRDAYNWRLGLVYVASKKLYKVVKLEFGDDSFRSPATVRIEALTVVQDEDEPGFGRRGRCDVDKQHPDTPSWEVITEHTMDSTITDLEGNLLSIDGVVYIIVYLEDGFEQSQVLSLGFEEDNNSCKICSLPKDACDEGNCDGCRLSNNLYQVKGLVCFPHRAASSVDLWLLKDRSSGIWFKGYTMSCIQKPFCHFHHLAYFPHPTISHGEGIIVFCVGKELFQYDIGTKETTYLSQDRCLPVLNVFSDNLYPLKDGLSCIRLAAETDSPVRKRKTLMPRHPAPQASLPPPPPPPYFYKKVYCKGLPPPPLPPIPFNPDDFEYKSPEGKRRKVHI